ncbi:hypothetical protein C8Q73DRAFT_678148, partial [Cubamyces lactineus]
MAARDCGEFEDHTWRVHCNYLTCPASIPAETLPEDVAQHNRAGRFSHRVSMP